MKRTSKPLPDIRLVAHWIRIGVAHSDERVLPSLSGLTPETMVRKTVACPESAVDPAPRDLLHAAIAWCAVHVDLLDLDRLAWLAERRVAGGFARALLGALCDAVVRLGIRPALGQSAPGGTDPGGADRIRVPASFLGMALEEAMGQAEEDWDELSHERRTAH